jgi:hypothetical protein
MMAAAGTKAWQIWRDRRGRLSPLRVAALLLLLVPAAIMAWSYTQHGVPARMWNDLVHRRSGVAAGSAVSWKCGG